MKFNWEIKFSDVLKILAWISAGLALLVSLTNWKTETDVHLNQVMNEQKQEEIAREKINDKLGDVSTHLARIEGEIHFLAASKVDPK